MRPQFPDVYSTEISYGFRGNTYEVLAYDGNIDVKEYYTDNEWSDLDEKDLEYWVGCLIYWYEHSWTNPWTEDDYRAAAYVCRAKGEVLEADDLERICGITTEFGVGPKDYAECMKAYKLFQAKCNPLAEGAD